VPTTGTFLPDINGNFQLTVRASLDPTTGTFKPSSTGNFFFPTRGDLISSTTGSAVLTFTPFNPLAALATLASFSPANTLAANPYSFSPAITSAAMNPYAYSSAYQSSAYQMPYSMPSQSSSYNAAAPTYTSAASSSASSSADYGPASVVGIPFEKGHVKWPLAFRLLPPDTKTNIADRLESDLLTLAGQSGNGNVNAGLVADASRNVARLGAWLKAHESDMAEATYTEGQAFVRMLDATLASMRY